MVSLDVGALTIRNRDRTLPVTVMNRNVEYDRQNTRPAQAQPGVYARRPRAHP
jgi:hypothetical protein